jgi:hypothetical protein
MGKWHEIQASIFNVNFWLFTSRPIKKAWDLCPRSSWSKRPLHEPYFQTEDCKLAWTLNPWIIIILSGDNIYVTGKWCHIKGLSTSWIMKLSLASLKNVIGHWTHVGTTSLYIEKEKCKSDNGTWGPPKVFMPTLSIVMVQWVLQWERQNRLSRCKF